MLQHSLEPSSDNISETIELYQVAYEFRQEVRHREDFEAYCQWYYDTADQHRAELAAMEKDIPLFSWFCRSQS